MGNFPGGSDGKASTLKAGDLGSIPGSGRSPGEGNDTPLQYSCLENPMDGGAWWTTVHGVAKNRTRLTSLTYIVYICQFQSPKSCQHPLFPFVPPWYPHVCSLCLCLYFCFAKNIICTNFFKFHIYALIYDIYFSLSDSLYFV